MNIKIITIAFFALLGFQSPINAQYEKQDTTFKRCFIGSTFFMLGNFLPENKPDFVQLNLGYRLTGKDVVSLELKTWKYSWSLGIPYGEFYEAPAEKFPGYIREFGFALAYQRFLWKGFYTAVHAMNAWQDFTNETGGNAGKGFQLFNTYRLGYHFKLFNDKWFIEPSIAVTHRVVHSEMPDGFKQLDNKWGKFFFAEPGLHFGFNF